MIKRIAVRALRIPAIKHKFYPERETLIEDLRQVHDKLGLDLEKLFSGTDMTLVHDVCGICRHLDRKTGELMDCFLPRTALPEKKDG